MNDQTPIEPKSDAGQPDSTGRLGLSPAAQDSDHALEAVKTLQYQLNTLLILLFIISGTLAVYFYMQCRYSGREVRNLRQHAMPQIDQYNTNTVPQVQRFLKDLARYAEQRPDLVPILTRYGLVSRNEAPAPGATAPPAATQP